MVEAGEAWVEEFVELCSETGEWYGLFEGRVGLEGESIIYGPNSIIKSSKSIIKFEDEKKTTKSYLAPVDGGGFENNSRKLKIKRQN